MIGEPVGDESPIQHRNHKKIFSDDILFIPEYIAAAINTSGVTLTQYIDTIRSAKTSPNFKGSWDLLYPEDSDMAMYAKTLASYNQMIYKTIGNEISNLLRIHLYILKMLDINYSSDADIERVLVKGLSKLDSWDLNNDFSPINLLKNRSDIEFNKTYSIVKADISLVILHDGFGNYIENKECKKILLDDILNSKELFMGNEVFSSSYMCSSIKLNLSI